MKICNNVKLYKNNKLFQEAYFLKLKNTDYNKFIDLVQFDLRIYECDYAIIEFFDKKERVS